MNIWYIYQHAIPPSQAGGTRHHVISKRLIERGHKVTVFSASFDHFSRCETRLNGNSAPLPAEEDGVPFLWFKVARYGDSRLRRALGWMNFAFKVWQYGRSGKLPRPDAIISSTPPMFSPFAAERLARKFNVPFILEVLDIWPDTLVDLTGVSKKKPGVAALYWLERYLYRNSQLIVSVPPRLGEYFLQKGLPPSRIQVLRNGVFMDQVPATPLPEDDEHFVITYAGHHGFANNLNLVIQAAAILENREDGKHIRFRLVGDGPYKATLQEQARSYNLKNIEFLPVISRNEIYNELSRADAFLMILRKAGVFKWGISPNKLADYMACCRPILFGVSTQDNPVRNAQAGMDFMPENPEALADAAVRLAQTPREERELMAKSGRAYAEKHHDLKRNVDDFVKQFESCFAKG